MEPEAERTGANPLDQLAHAGLIHSLHEHGIINAQARAMALTWLRQGVEWRAWAGNLLLGFGVALILAGIVLFVATNWEYVGRLAKFAGLEVLLVGCAVGAWYSGLDRLAGKVLLVAASVLVGAMLLLIGIEYPTGAEAYELFTAWAVLILGWVLVSRCSGHWLLWLALVNTAIVCYWEARPHDLLWYVISDSDSFAAVCITLALVDGLALAAREITVRRGSVWLAGRESRLLPLLAVMVALFLPTVWLIVELSRASVLLAVAAGLNVAVIAAAIFIYRRVLPEMSALVLCALSVCLLLTIGAGRILFEEMRHFGDEAFRFLAFAVVILLIFGAGVVWLKRVHRAMSGETHADNE
jgi:uncharacterized membrane protein